MSGSGGTGQIHQRKNKRNKGSFPSTALSFPTQPAPTPKWFCPLATAISVQHSHSEVTGIHQGFGFPSAGQPGAVALAGTLSSSSWSWRQRQLKHSTGLDHGNTKQVRDRVTVPAVSAGAAGFNSLIEQNYSDVLWLAWASGAQGVLHSASPTSRTLLPRQLLIELGHVVIPLRLVASARHRHPQVVLAAERSHLEFPSFVTGAIGEDGLVAAQLLRLLVHQPHVAVQPCREGTALQVPPATPRFMVCSEVTLGSEGKV